LEHQAWDVTAADQHLFYVTGILLSTFYTRQHVLPPLRGEHLKKRPLILAGVWDLLKQSRKSELCKIIRKKRASHPF
jgi:hypothetical protein